MLTISTNYSLRLFDLEKMRLWVNVNIMDLVRKNGGVGKERKKVVESVMVGERNEVVLRFGNGKRYVLNAETATWCLIPSSIASIKYN